MPLQTQFPATFLTRLSSQRPLPFSDSFARADGDVGNGWDYAGGVWVIADNKLVANPTLGAELAANGNMESGDPPTGVTAINGSSLSAQADERTGGAGAQSLQIARGSSSTAATKTTTITAKQFYKTGVWSKLGTGTEAAVQGGFVWRTNFTTEWVFLPGFGYDNDTFWSTIFYSYGSAGQTTRWDDLTIKQATRADLFFSRDVATPNVRVGVELSNVALYPAGIVLAADDAANPQSFVLGVIEPYDNTGTVNPKIDLYKFVNGTMTALATDLSFSYTEGGLFEIEYAGGIVRLFYNGIQVSVDYEASDAEIIANTRHGLLSADVTNAFANCTLTAASPIALDGDGTAMFAVTTAAANLWSSAAPNDWLGRATMADLGSVWAATYIQAADHTSASGQVHVRFSDDEGATWTAADTTLGGAAVTGAPFTAHGTNIRAGEPLIFVAPNGDLILHVSEGGGEYGTFQYRSTDGGATWTDEGMINSDGLLRSGQDYTVVGSDIYMVFLRTVTLNGDYPYTVRVFKSSDNAATWVEVGIVESSTLHSNEAGIEHLGGSRFVVVKREGDTTNVTHIYFSNDNCVTWTARAEIPNMGKFQRPRLKPYAGGIMMFGRDKLTGPSQTVVWYSPDDGVHWGRKFYPDATAFSDTGYCDVLERADGKFYMLTYGGTTAAASVRSAVFEIA